MSAKKTKLPKHPSVLMIFRKGHYKNDPLGFEMTRAAFELTKDEDEYTVKYAPVQPPRRCRWTRDEKSSLNTNGHTACGWWVDREATFNYCPRCGGKIVGKIKVTK